MSSADFPAENWKGRWIQVNVNARGWQPALFGFLLGAGLWVDRAWYYLPLFDVFLWVAAALVLKFAAKPAGQAVPRWALALVIALALSCVWSANPTVTGFTAARILCFAVLARWALANWSAGAFALGIGAGLAPQTVVLLEQLATGRNSGLSRHISLLGGHGYAVFAAMPMAIGPRFPGPAQRWLLALNAALMIAVSMSRSPLIAVFGHGALNRSFALAMAIALFFVANVVVVDSPHLVKDRLLPMGVWKGVVGRSATVTDEAPAGLDTIEGVVSDAVPSAGSSTPTDDLFTRSRGSEDQKQVELANVREEPPSWSQEWLRPALGTGMHAYLFDLPWPRPHILYVLAWHELKALSLLPVGLLAWALWTRRLSWRVVLPFLLFGLMDDTLWSVEGLYGSAVVFTAAAAKSKGEPDYA